jgi:predicted nucleic acid-binding protein
MVDDPPGAETITRDPNDDYLVRLARSAAVTTLVSGDRDLLEADVADVDIVTPRAFIDRVESSQT